MPPRRSPRETLEMLPAEHLDDQRDILYVEPGQLLACTEPRRLRTILGSCVSVCLYDPSLRIGGMNHFMLPRAPQADVLSFRYGDRAMAGLGGRPGRPRSGPAQPAAARL